MFCEQTGPYELSRDWHEKFNSCDEQESVENVRSLAAMPIAPCFTFSEPPGYVISLEESERLRDSLQLSDKLSPAQMRACDWLRALADRDLLDDEFYPVIHDASDRELLGLQELYIDFRSTDAEELHYGKGIAIPSEIAELRCLRKLCVYFDPYLSLILPRELAQVPLAEVSLRGCFLRDIPRGLISSRSITHLALEHCVLPDDYTDYIPRLSFLEVLTLRACLDYGSCVFPYCCAIRSPEGLAVQPERFAALLEEDLIGSCELPEDIANLSALRYVSIWSDELSVPDEFSQLRGLECLELQAKELKLPRQVLQMDSLKHVRVSAPEGLEELEGIPGYTPRRKIVKIGRKAKEHNI